MRARQRGFTLIELMIAVAIIGILAAIAIPTFVNFVGKGKKVEAHLAVDKLTKDLRVYHQAKVLLPPSTNIMPGVAACDSPTDKTPATKASDWFANPGWATLEFHIDEPGYFQYSWTKNSDTEGVVEAMADFDCDGTKAYFIVEVSIATGNVFEAITSDIND